MNAQPINAGNHWFGEDRLHVKRYPDHVDAWLFRVPIGHAELNHVDSRELEHRMRQIDWQTAQYPETRYDHRLQATVSDQPAITNILNDIQGLYDAEQKQSYAIAKALEIKYWSLHRFGELIPSQHQYDAERLVVSGRFGPGATEEEVYGVLKAISQEQRNAQIPQQRIDQALQPDYIFHSLNYKKMNEQNLEYLKNGLTNLGYGDKLHKDLEMAMERKQTDIQLRHRNNYNGDVMDYTLHLKKSDKSDMYFLNSTEATLKKEGQEQEIKQSFGIKKNHGITAKEAYNLMDGRSIEKKLYNDDGTVQSRWLKLDFEQKNEYGNYKMYRMYPYNLERELNKYPIAELSNDYNKNELIRSLKKGNEQQVTVEQNGQQIKYYLSANPAERTLDIYDANKNVVKRELLQKQDQRKEQKQENQQTQKNSNKKRQGQHK